MSKHNKHGLALITRASSVIGTTLCQPVGAARLRPLLVARDQARLDDLAVRLHAGTGVNVETLRADLTVAADVAQVAQRLSNDPAATRTKLWARAGIDTSNLLPEMVMDVDERVYAALAGLDLGETVTIPTLPDVRDWDTFNAMRLDLGPRLPLEHAAWRYARATTVAV